MSHPLPTAAPPAPWSAPGPAPGPAARPALAPRHAGETPPANSPDRSTSRLGRHTLALLVLGSLTAAFTASAAAAGEPRPESSAGPGAKANVEARGEATAPPLDPAAAARFAELALSCVHREYPNKIAHVLHGDADARPPRVLHPAFYGCYDWHSSVHGHWLLARLARLLPDQPFAARARAALDQSLRPESIAAELTYLDTPGRASWERPYGLAWLLQLAAELAEWDDPDARRWAAALAPLERASADRLLAWLPKLTYPIRIGEHDQTAFALGLALDWARVAGDRHAERLLVETSGRLYLRDRTCPLAYEPSGQDFLSPCLAEADLMRRVLTRAELAVWLRAFLPQIPSVRPDQLDAGTPSAATDATAGALQESEDGRPLAVERVVAEAQLPSSVDLAAWLPVALVTDRADPKLAHLDGLNLARAWMLEGIASALRPDDDLRPALLAAARAHRQAALPHVTAEHYEGGHWLGSFATYLVTQRGLLSGRVSPSH